MSFSLFSFFSNLQNHVTLKRPSMLMKYTRKTLKIVKLFREAGLILDFEIISKDTLTVFFKYTEKGSVFTTIKIISKPGRKVFVSNKFFNKKTLKGVYILSSQNGFYIHSNIIRGNFGGELICQVI